MKKWQMVVVAAAVLSISGLLCVVIEDNKDDVGIVKMSVNAIEQVVKADSSGGVPARQPDRKKLVVRRIEKAQRNMEIDRIKLRLDNANRNGNSLTVEKIGQEELERRDGSTSEFVKAALKEIFPVVKDCYKSELRSDPETYGHLVASVEIIADNEYGALVETSEIEADDAISGKEEFIECIRETLYTMKFEQLSTQGRMKINMPIVMSVESNGGRLLPNIPEDKREINYSFDGWRIDQ